VPEKERKNQSISSAGFEERDGEGGGKGETRLEIFSADSHAGGWLVIAGKGCWAHRVKGKKEEKGEKAYIMDCAKGGGGGGHSSASIGVGQGKERDEESV